MSGRSDYTASDATARLDGRWIAKGGIRVFKPFRPRVGRPPQPVSQEWTYERLCRAHRDYAAGLRDDETREGERLYHRIAKRRQRAAKRAMERTAA